MTNHTLNHDRASDMLPVLAYDPQTHLFYNEDQTLGFAFVCQSVAGHGTGLSDRVRVALNSEWPANTIVQVIQWLSPDIGEFVTQFADLRSGIDRDYVRDAVAERVQFLQNGTKEPIIPSLASVVRGPKLYVTVKIPIAKPMPDEEEMRQADTLRTRTEEALAQIGLVPVPMDNHQWVHAMSSLLNHGPAASWRAGPMQADPDKPLREQAIDFDASLRRDHKSLTLGPKTVRTLSIKRFPEAIYFGHAAAYIRDLEAGVRGITQNVVISATMIFPDQTAAKAKLNNQRAWATKQAFGPLLRFQPMLGLKKKGFDVLFNAFDDGDRPVRLYLGIAIFADSEDEAEAAVSNAQTYWGELGFTLMEDRFFNLPLFLHMLPLCSDPKLVMTLFRYKTMATRHVVPLLPIFGEYTGTGTPVVTLLSRAGTPISFNPYDSPTNYNLILGANSGGGKSFLANELTEQFLSTGARLWTIDKGRSYEGLAERLGGEFTEFGEKSGTCLNPFPLVKNYVEESDMLCGLVAAMAAPTQPLSDLQSAELRRLMRELWERHGNDLLIDNIATELRKQSDQRVADLGKQLYPFTSAGEYGRFFVGENNVSFRGDWSVLELNELHGRKHLQTTVLLQLMYQIAHDMYREKADRSKICIIDEAWELICPPSGSSDTYAGRDVAAFIEGAYRTFRKYGGAACIIQQGFKSLFDTAVGRAIIENSANMIFLQTGEQAVADLRKEGRLPLPDAAYDLLPKLKTVKGQFSELLISTPTGVGVGRLVVEEYRRLLYSTVREDKQAINAYRRNGEMGYVQAAKAVLAERRKANARAA